MHQNILGMDFKSPLGLAAGFDKNAEMTDICADISFGFTEIGSITGRPCIGNPKPRLWRLIKSKAIVVYYGLKNDGCEKIAEKLKDKKFKLPVFTSIAKTNSPDIVELKAEIEDYVKAYKTLINIGDMSVINISCPNIFGGNQFSDPENLQKLLTEIEKIRTKKPVFIKFPPDLKPHQIDKILNVLKNYSIAGIICTNLTKDRNNTEMMSKIVEKNIPEHGGISGKPVEELANETIKYIYSKTKRKYVIIGCGGISSAADAYKKIRLGASLVQMITGMIYEGPEIMSEINLGLCELLKKDGYKNISEAVGKQ